MDLTAKKSKPHIFILHPLQESLSYEVYGNTGFRTKPSGAPFAGSAWNQCAVIP